MFARFVKEYFKMWYLISANVQGFRSFLPCAGLDLRVDPKRDLCPTMHKSQFRAGFAYVTIRIFALVCWIAICLVFLGSCLMDLDIFKKNKR